MTPSIYGTIIAKSFSQDRVIIIVLEDQHAGLQDERMGGGAGGKYTHVRQRVSTLEIPWVDLKDSCNLTYKYPMRGIF